MAISFAALVAATAVLIGGASYVTTDRQVTEEIDDFLRERADEIADGERRGPQGRGGRNDRPDTQVVLAVEPDAEVQLLDSDGSITSSSSLVLPVDSADIVLADKKAPPRLRTVTIDGDEYRMITEHIPGGGAVQVARSLEEANSLLDVLRSRFLLIGLGMALLAGVIGWVLARRTTKPLRSLTSAVDSVTETQDFSVPIDATGSDEIGRLARGFDRMLRALDVSREQQQRLVQDAAHELRTPLTSIKANVDWLSQAEGADADTRAQALEGVQRELGELNGVITEIIELATDRYELPPFAPLDLADVGRDSVQRFRARSDRTVELDASPTLVVGDADALGRAVMNLLTNAEKYSPPGTTIAARVGDGGIWVCDQGAGIPIEERELIFDRFYRSPADRSQPGSGLGLSIVAGIVDAHDGAVSVSDSPHGGACVGFTLNGASQRS
ncbi:MAG: ATP-binding protein [Acidimicrobiales bacterium]